MLDYKWNTTDPNLMLGLPTKVAQTDEMEEETQRRVEAAENEDHHTTEQGYGSEGDSASVVEVDNQEFPPHILADL